MKKISINDYNPSMGLLIDVRDKYYYDSNHYPNSVNIPLEKLLLNHQKVLKPNEKYYITCKKGYKSKKAVSILEFYGYDVTQVINN